MPQPAGPPNGNARQTHDASDDSRIAMSEFNKALTFAYRTNIERYQRLLRTHLAANERTFIEQRLAEDEQALRELAKSTQTTRRPDAA
jgi:hypothetical protein